MIHVVDVPSSPRVPRAGPIGVSATLLLHAFAIGGAVMLARVAPSPPMAMAVQRQLPAAAPPVTHLIFIARESSVPSGGGGGGGNRQSAPIRKAQAVGTDRTTVRIAHPVSVAGQEPDAEPLPALVLDAIPLSSGALDQLGLPVGGVPSGTSLGPGSGGGVGEGVGTGIGSGRGPGMGPGSGGGTGGSVYRVGGLVTAPRVRSEVKPTYTNRAMVEHIEGTVVLALIVRASGAPSDIRVIRSLDAGLDEEAIRAASQWRFEPGRLNGVPVDVAVSLQVDFHIR